MADEPENLTIRLLQEIRTEMQTRFAETQDRLADLQERFTDLTQRVDGNTLVFNLVAGVVHDHEERLQHLESSAD